MILTVISTGQLGPVDCTYWPNVMTLDGDMFLWDRPTIKSIATALALALILIGCGGGEKLDARVLELSISYAVDGPVLATMSGARGTTTSGTTVECRLTSDGKPLVGQATADQFGAFEMTLDHTEFPDHLPKADEFATFNKTIECRPKGGSWVSPLRPPLISVS